MATAKGLASYESGWKRNWRGWQWNECTRRLAQAGVHPHAATVLYLCGPDDVDRRMAVKRGFSDHNLIAVDCIDENVRLVRSRGGLAINADLATLLANWPDDWRIDLVIGDFCHGLDNGSIAFIRACLTSRALMARSAGDGTAPVLSVNLQRGRDAATNDLRAELWDHLVTAAPGVTGLAWRHAEPQKHRGLLFFQAFMLGLLSLHAALRFPEYGNAPLEQIPACGIVSMLELGRMAAQVADPSHNSYTSTRRTWFDSVVFTVAPFVDCWPPVIESTIHDIDATRKIAALRAMRTKMIKRSVAGDSQQLMEARG